MKADAGDIFINGENIRNKDMIELRRNIGYAIQGSVLFSHMTVEQNISYENVPGRLWANGWESLAWKKNLFGQGMRLPGAGFRMNCRESMHRLISQYSL